MTGEWGQSFLQKPISCLKQSSSKVAEIDVTKEGTRRMHEQRTPGAPKRGKVSEERYRDSFCMRLGTDWPTEDAASAASSKVGQR